jgi:hypothetical protein
LSLQDETSGLHFQRKHKTYRHAERSEESFLPLRLYPETEERFLGSLGMTDVVGLRKLFSVWNLDRAWNKPAQAEAYAT